MLADPGLAEYLSEHESARVELDSAIGTLVLPRKYVPIEPHPKQEWFLLHDDFEVFFGGAAGPGKSWSLLMAALQYVEVPGYHALLIRPTLGEFEQQGGLMELAQTWLARTDAWWHGGKREWRFPSGASIKFGYLKNHADLARYPGGGISFLGFDEVTLQYSESLYTGMFRLLRQAVGTPLDDVPLRVRSASNPGNVGHNWVKGRFIDPKAREPGAVFIPAGIADNPSLDYDTYVNTVLVHMDPVERQRLIRGDWDVMEEGGKFKRGDFVLVSEDEAPPPLRRVRYWDLAGTEPSPTNKDPDWTVGLLYTIDKDNRFTIRDINMLRQEDDEVENAVRAQAELDGVGVEVHVEQDPGQAGKAQIRHYKLNVLQGFAVYAGSTRIRGKPAAKAVRAGPVAAAVGNGFVRLVRGRNFREFLGQTSMFPHEGSHDDCVDALSGAHNVLTRVSPPKEYRRSGTSVARARIPGVGERRNVDPLGSR